MRGKKKDWGLDTLLSIVGFVFELLRVIVHGLRKRGGNIEHLRRLLKEPALADRVLDLVVLADPDMVLEYPLGKNEYVVHVDYGSLPTLSELEQEFGKGHVSNLFDGRPFTRHANYASLVEKSGGKIFLLKHFKYEIESEEAIVNMDELGYRPATHYEAYVFQKANPELQLQSWILALGSTALIDGQRDVAMLFGESGERGFGSCSYDVRWRAIHRFLFVRK